MRMDYPPQPNCSWDRSWLIVLFPRIHFWSELSQVVCPEVRCPPGGGRNYTEPKSRQKTHPGPFLWTQAWVREQGKFPSKWGWGMVRDPKWVTLLFSTLSVLSDHRAQRRSHSVEGGSVNQEIKESGEETKSDKRMNWVKLDFSK